jgi:hypothetical protein
MYTTVSASPPPPTSLSIIGYFRELREIPAQARDLPSHADPEGWIPYILDHMDLEWEDQFKDLDLKMKPSDYWRRQCYATYQSDRIGIKLLDEIGEDNIMWGSDFPHPDGIWPDSQEYHPARVGPLAGCDAP